MFDDLEHSNNAMLPIFAACLGYAIYNITDVIIKDVSSQISASQILCYAYAYQFIAAVLYGIFFAKGAAFKTTQLKLLLARSSVSSIATIASVSSIAHLKLTSFYTIVFTAPLWVTILSGLVLKDKIGKNKIIAIAIGFVSILFMFRPSSGIFNIWSCILLFSAFLSASDLLLVRKLGSKENKVNIFIAGCGVGLLVNLPILYFHYVPFTLKMITLLTVSSTLGIAGFLLIIFAYQRASTAALVAPFNYTQIIWGSMLGYFIFNEVPSHTTIIGSIMIVLSGVYLMASEHWLNNKARERRAVRSTTLG